MRIQRLSALATVVALVTAACGATTTPVPASPGGPQGSAGPVTTQAPTSTPGPVEGGTFTYAMQQETLTLDTVNSGATTSSAVRNMIYDKLYVFKPNSKTLEVEPQLAISAKSEGSSWTVTLKTGIKFHDGTPFNAAAVKAHYDRLIGPEKPVAAGDWTPFLASVEVINDSTVKFNMKAPDPRLPQRLAGTAGSIESPAAFKKYGADIQRNPVGTGPFVFAGWVNGDRIELVRNNDYWGGRPHLDRVVIRTITEAGSRVVAVQSGDVQLVGGVQPEQVPQIKSDSKLAVESWPTTRQLFVGMHNLKAPFDKMAVRQALNQAIDWPTITKTIYQGTAAPAGGPVPAFAVGAANVSPFTYDKTKAKAALTAAGFPNGFSTTFVGTNGSYLKDNELAQVIQQQLAEIGVTVKLEIVEFARYIALVRQPTLTSELVMWLDSWQRNDAAEVLRDRYHCDMFRPAGTNLDGYCNRDVAKQIEQAEQTFDEAARVALLKQIQTTVATEAPSIWGIGLDQAWARSTKVHDAAHLGEEIWADENTWLEK